MADKIATKNPKTSEAETQLNPSETEGFFEVGGEVKVEDEVEGQVKSEGLPPIQGSILFDDPRVEGSIPSDEVVEDPFGVEDTEPTQEITQVVQEQTNPTLDYVSKAFINADSPEPTEETRERVSEQADFYIWAGKRATLEELDLKEGDAFPESYLGDYSDKEIKNSWESQFAEASLLNKPLEVTGATTREEGDQRLIPQPAQFTPDPDVPLLNALDFDSWVEQSGGEATREVITNYYLYLRRYALDRGLMSEELETSIAGEHVLKNQQLLDLDLSSSIFGVNSSPKFERESAFVKSQLDEDLGPAPSDLGAYQQKRTARQMSLFNEAKKRAVEKGEVAFATIYKVDAEGKRRYTIIAGDYNKMSLANRTEALAAAYKAVEEGVLDQADLWKIDSLLQPSSIGTRSIAQERQDVSLRQDIINLANDMDEQSIVFKDESINTLLLAILKPKKETLQKWWNEDAMGNRPETLNEALEWDNFIKDSQFRGIQKRLVLQQLKKEGRDAEFEAVNNALLDKEWRSKFIPDDLTHKYGIKRLRQIFRELAAIHANNSGVFKFFNKPTEYHKNIRVTPMGEVLIAPQLQYRKEWFEAALSQYKTVNKKSLSEQSLSDRQLEQLRFQRENFMLARYDTINRVLEETSGDTSEAWKKIKDANNALPEGNDQKKGRVALLDDFLADEENYSAFKSQTGAFWESIWDEGITGFYHNIASILGSDSSAKALLEIQERASDRRELAKLFGDQYGLGMEVGTSLAPMVVDVTATAILTAAGGTAGAGYVLAKQGTRLTASGYFKLVAGRMLAKEIGETTKDATERVLATGLIKNSSKETTYQGVLKGIKAYNGIVANKLAITGSVFATSASRSAGGTYVSVYSALKKENPERSHEWLHDRSLGPALAGGLLTGLLTVGFQAIGRGKFGGFENALFSNMSWKKAKGVLNSIKRTGTRELSDDVAKEAFSKIMKKRLKEVLARKVPELLTAPLSEGFEESIDTFINTFVEDWATGKSRSLGERVALAGHAFKIGAFTTAAVRPTTFVVEKVRGVDLSDPKFFEEQQISSIARELQNKLIDTGSPMTADAIEEILNRPAAQPQVSEDAPVSEILPAARPPRVPPEQRDEHISQIADVLKGQDPVEGLTPFLNDLPQIDDPDLLELAEKDTNYNVNSDGVILGIRNVKTGQWVGQEPDEDAATINRPQVPDGVDPNDLRYPSTDLTEDLVTEDQIKAETKRWAGVNEKQLKNKGIKVKSTNLNRKDPSGVKSARVAIAEDGSGKGVPVIEMDFAGLTRRLNEVDAKDRYKVFNAILGEELTHAAEIIQFKAGFKKLNGADPTADELKAYSITRYEAMYADMSREERIEVVKAYNNIPADEVVLPEQATEDVTSQMTEVQIASEFTRMLVQYGQSKTTTEATLKLASSKVFDFLSEVAKRITNNFLSAKHGFKGPVTLNLKEHLKSVNGFLSDFVLNKAEQGEVDPKLIDEDQLVNEVVFDSHDSEGNPIFRDWGHLGNSSKKWTSQGKERDGSTMISRDRDYKLVKRVEDPTDKRKDKFELINLVTQSSEGVFDNQFDAINKHKELTSQRDNEFQDPDIEPPKAEAATEEDKVYLDLLEGDNISENEQDIQRMVFEAALNPAQIEAVKNHAEAVASGDTSAVQQARLQMGAVGLGDVAADAISQISDPTKAMSAVLEKFGLDPRPFTTDEAGTFFTLSERFPKETQIVPVNPATSNTTNIDEELRVVEKARIVSNVASQWGVEVVFTTEAPTNRGDVWSEEGKIYVDTNAVHETIQDLNEEDADKLMSAKAMAQVSVALSLKEYTTDQISNLSKETSDEELNELVDTFYPNDSLRAEAKSRLQGKQGDLAAGQEISFLIRQKIANATSLILQGQTVSSLEADIRKRRAFKSQLLTFMKRVFTRLTSIKKEFKKNPELKVSLHNLAERIKTFRGVPTAPKRTNFNPNDVAKQLDLFEDLLNQQAPLSDESKVDTSNLKNQLQALNFIANSDSRFASVAQDIIESRREASELGVSLGLTKSPLAGSTLDFDFLDLPDEATPSQILRAFLRDTLDLALLLPKNKGVDVTLKGQALQDALIEMVADIRESKSEGGLRNQQLILWETYLRSVDAEKVTLETGSVYGFRSFLGLMLSDSKMQDKARADVVGDTNSWDRFTEATAAIMGAPMRGVFQKETVLDIINSSKEDIDLGATAARRDTTKITPSRAVEILELPVFETGSYKRPSWLKRAFVGDLDPRLRRLVELRRQYQKYLGAELRQYRETMDSLMESEFGGRANAPLELIRLASGSTKGVVLSDAIEEQIESEYQNALDIIAEAKLPSGAKEEAVNKAKAKRHERRRLEEGKLADALKEDIQFAKDALREQSPAMADHLQFMRDGVDRLSKETARLIGGPVGNEDLKIHFDAQLEIYLTRTYKIFSEEGWIDTVLENPDYHDTRTEAIKWFEEKFVQERAKNIIANKNRKPTKKWAELTDELKYELAIEMARDEVAAQEDLGQNLMEEFLYRYETDSIKIKSETDSQEAKRQDVVDSLKRKLTDEQLPKSVRSLLGEYAENTGDYNLMRTFLNVGELASKQAFLHGMVDLGRSGNPKDWWLLTKKEVEERGLQREYTPVRDMSKVPARKNRKGSISFDPLIDYVENGKSKGPLYASIGIVSDFRSYLMPPDTETSTNAIAVAKRFFSGLLSKPTGLAMAAVTLGSIPFYVRNVVSNSLFFGPAQGFIPDRTFSTKGIAEIARVYRTDKERDAARLRMIKLGVLGEEVTTNAWEELLKNNFDQDTLLKDLRDSIGRVARFHEKAMSVPSGVLEKLKQSAIAADSWYKIALYEHELKTLKEAQAYAVKRDPTDPYADTDLWTEAKLEEEAARKVLMVAQSYSQAPPVVKGFVGSAVGNLIAPFFRFTAEIPRIIGNTYKLGGKELKSNNPILQRRGRLRRMSMTGMLLAGPTIAAFFKQFSNIDDEEEEAFRESAPKWAKKQTIIYVRGSNKQGPPISINATYVNPLTMGSDAVYRLVEYSLKGDVATGIRFAWAAMVGTPIAEGQIFIDGANNFMNNEDDFGNEIYGVDDDFHIQALDGVGYLFSKAFQPPTLKRLFGETRRGARRPLLDAFDEPRSFNNIQDLFLTPLGLATAEGIPLKPRAVDTRKAFAASFRKAARLKRSADRVVDNLKTDKTISTSAIKAYAADYLKKVEKSASQALKYGKTYREKWDITQEDIDAERKKVLTKAGYEKWLSDRVVLVRGLSDEDKKNIEELAAKVGARSQSEEDKVAGKPTVPDPNILQRIKDFEEALERRTDNGYITLPDSPYITE